MSERSTADSSAVVDRPAVADSAVLPAAASSGTPPAAAAGDSAAPAADARLEALTGWLAGVLPGRTLTLRPASADASFRRYFRVRDGDSTWIAMDAPPPQEDCRPFVHVAGLLRAAGVHAPEIFAADLERGFLLLTDFGDLTYLDCLDDDNADALMADARAALLQWQLASRPGTLPAYTEALLRREVDLFPDWYVARHLGRPLSAQQRATFTQVTDLIIRRNLAQPAVFVHRDYMPRNLMHTAPNPGVIDFQDAVEGPITYDMASLLRDAFISWDEERELDWAARYWQSAKRAGLPVAADFGEFYADLEWMAAQRHLKVAGIFARICHRDGKPKYVADTPRFIGYLRRTAHRYPALSPLARLLDELEGVARETHATF